jgi:hypothetical protein
MVMTVPEAAAFGVKSVITGGAANPVALVRKSRVAMTAPARFQGLLINGNGLWEMTIRIQGCFVN